MSIFRNVIAGVTLAIVLGGGFVLATSSSAATTAAVEHRAKIAPAPAPPSCFTVAVAVPAVSLDPALLASGDAVASVQAALNIPSDGVYGPQTAAAVSAVGESTPVSVCPPDYAVNSPIVGSITTLSAQSADLTAQAEAARAAAAAAAAAAPRSAAPRPALSGGPSSCDGHVIPGYILQKESGCSYDAFNATGCGGRGCVGLYQEDLGHFAAVSPWNSNASGSCYGLDPNTPAGQDACVNILSNGGTNLNPWAATR